MVERRAEDDRAEGGPMKPRRSNRAKRISHGCRNNGTCPHCTGSRTHANRRAEPADADEQMRFAEEERREANASDTGCKRDCCAPR